VFDRNLYNKLRSKIRKDSSGCWIWTGAAFLKRKWAAHRYGYSCIKIDGIWRTRTTHRLMWYALHGWPKKPLCVCHKCDVPLCINPRHLFLGTHLENIQDSRRKGRHFVEAKDWKPIIREAIEAYLVADEIECSEDQTGDEHDR
jgi:hypothetical protein